MKKLTKSQLKAIKSSFEQRKNELINKIKSANDQELDVDGDDVDLVQGNIISEINSKISQRDIQALEKINYSLDRMAEGNFGICEECDEPIGEKRLMAIPGCSMCISCAEQQESEARQFTVSD